ncbi:unnamed protein product [Fraxinus pennsylvanica]|uniref:Phosphoribosylglycinamide synthetase ATP-grasp (A) domain-containing protein n=1 Tax=Fraxinus pennsylvanica TaxID=56036 RepID=A0AAD1ZV20_9LAMI|nr:unnamed protein product [Fraxinus pennsylvanica]
MKSSKSLSSNNGIPASEERVVVLVIDEGGMGVYSSTSVLTKELQSVIMESIIFPTVKGMAEEGYKWHSAGTFYVCNRTRGPFGAMKFPAELARGPSNGLDIVLRLLQLIRELFLILSHC